MAYKKLFEPGRIGGLTIRNRAVMSPMGTDLADIRGNATPRLIAYYTERAKGGIGLIINEYTGVDDVDSIPTQHNLRMAQDYNVQEAEELTRSVHAYGAKIFAQLHHGGATSKSAFTGRQNLSPSGVPMAPGGEVPREMTLEDIKRVQEKFIAAAIRCKKAGYDGVELHGAHSYLIAQFFSKYYNRRTDAYGGSLENRCRFIDEIIAGIRAKLGRYPISVRICGDEMTDEPGFLTLEDGLEIGRHLEAQGIDCINISNGSSWNGNANCEPFSYTPGWKKHVAKAFKEALSIPVIATNTIKDPDFAESLLEEGVSDFVALGRSQFADPEFMNKARAGKPESIRKCIGCMYCRERLLGNAMPVECSLNPRLGREYRYRWQDLQKNGNSRPVVVVGGGPGGYVAAIRAAQLGARVTLVEREHIGGTCLNIGCIPTKCLLHSAELVSEIKEQGADIGVKVSGVEVDFPQVIAHKNAISKQLTQGVAGLLKQNKVARVDGEASFTGPKTLSVKKSDGSVEEMTADAIIVATGSVNAQPPIPGLKENPNCIDSTGALSLEKLPKSMVVIGGGVIGLELACAYAAFGTKITVVEALDHMLPMLDGDLTAIGVKHMKKMGMEFNLECPVQAVEASPVGAKVTCRNKAGETVSFEAEKVLVAIGRKANTASLNLEAAGLANDRGRIIVNDKMETSVPGVYAIGDCVKGYAQLAHTASAMGEVAAENICGMEAHYDESTNPTCVYIEPEAASVGLTEEQAKAQGIDYMVGKFPMSANGKALILNGGEGLVKIIAGREYGEVLGMHIIGPRATDLICEGALAIGSELTLDELAATIHSHPTVTETMRECALDALGRAVHIPPRRK